MGVELMADDQWLVITRGARRDVWNLGSTFTTEQIEDLVRRARLLVGITAADDTPGVAGISPGRPHEQTLLSATVHELTDLTGIAPATVDAYRQAQHAARRTARVDGTAAQVTALPSEEQAELRTRLGWGAPRPNGMPQG